MRTRVSLFVLVAAALFTPHALALAEPRVEPSRLGGNWYASLDPMFVNVESKTGGRVTMSFNDSDTPAVDLSLLGADGIHRDLYAPRTTLGWRYNDASGVSMGFQARFLHLRQSMAAPARLAPGTVALPNFATTSETGSFEMYTGDFEIAGAYSGWGFTVEGTYGNRAARFDAAGEIEAFGVFTTGNFVQLQMSNGSAFQGHGHVEGFTIAYRAPQVPVSVFVGRRTSTLEGESDSFGRSVGAVASSPSAPLIGAATVRRDNEDETEMELNETRYGLQADFGTARMRFRPFARLTYERMTLDLDGPPTGGAGFGGTINDLTTNSFASAGLGGATLTGWSLSMGMTF